MAHERSIRKLNPQQIVPPEHSWQRLLDAEGTELEAVYTEILLGLAQHPGTLGTIFRKAQNRVQDPAKLTRLIVDLIDAESWSASGTDLKGDAYEELLSKGASDKGSGAGQYFTPAGADPRHHRRHRPPSGRRRRRPGLRHRRLPPGRPRALRPKARRT